MDIVVTGRQTNVADQFRSHAEEKVSKAQSLAPKTQRIEVMVSHEPNRRQAKAAERVEITCYAKGPVIRAEASAGLRFELARVYARLGDAERAAEQTRLFQQLRDNEPK